MLTITNINKTEQCIDCNYTIEDEIKSGKVSYFYNIKHFQVLYSPSSENNPQYVLFVLNYLKSIIDEDKPITNEPIYIKKEIKPL